MDFETEEQQIEAIKKWWKDNAAMVIGGIAIGVSSIFGWQYYQGQQVVHTENASLIYEQVTANSQSVDTISEQLTRVNQLQAEYSDTPYASLSALLLAKQQMAAGNFAQGEEQLKWVAANATQDELSYLAKIRLARLYLSTEKADMALTILDEPFPESFHAMLYELKGDVLTTQGKTEEAKAAYEQAVIKATTPSRWLRYKIQDTGTPTAKEDA